MIKKNLVQAVQGLGKVANHQGSDSDFEKSFSNVAHAFLADKSPTLLQYELGFQLLDRNEDNTRAVGVFAFKVGAQIMYGPQFFLNGDLKGYELLYLKNQDMFVPVSEQWLNHIINKRPESIGEPHQYDSGEGMFKSPNLRALYSSPMKVASAVNVASYAKDFLPLYEKMANVNVDEACNELGSLLGETLSVDRLLKQADSAMMAKAAEHMEDSRVFQAVVKWHGLEKFSRAVHKADRQDSDSQDTLLGAITNPAQNPITKVAEGPLLDNDESDVTVYESKYELPEGTDNDELKSFYTNGNLVRDKRKPAELSKLVDEQRSMQFTSPTESGMYAVLDATGQLHDKIILTNVRDMRNSSNRVFILDPSDKSVCGSCSADQRAVMTVNLGEDVKIGYKKWFDSLSDVGELETGKRYCFVSETGRVTDDIYIVRKLGVGGDGMTSYDVSCSGMSALTAVSPMGYDRGTRQDYPGRSGTLVVGNKASSTISYQSGSIFVPANAKKLEYKYSYDDTEELFQPGDLRDARRRLLRITESVEFTSNRHDSHYSLGKDLNLKKSAALRKLMVDFGLGEEDARGIIKEAEARPGETIKTMIKRGSSPYLSAAPDPSTPPMPAGLNQGNVIGFKGPVGDNFDVSRPVASMSSDNYPKQGYMYQYNEMERGLKGFIQNSANEGKRDVFDVGMLSSMLMVASDDRLIDQWVPDLIKGMDRIGRLLFLFYWHYDKFEGRFGQQDLPELEEFLRTAFDLLGKLILFLKNKNIQDSPSEGGADVGLQNQI